MININGDDKWQADFGEAARGRGMAQPQRIGRLRLAVKASPALAIPSPSGTGTITVNTTVNVTSITCQTLTGGNTLDFGTNNNNVTAQTVDFSGAGTRSINMGSGTWTITGTSGNIFNGGGTNLTPTFSNAALVFSGNGAARLFQNAALRAATAVSP